MDSDDVPLIRKSIRLTALLIVLTAAVVRLADTQPQPPLLSQNPAEQFSCDYISLETNREAGKTRTNIRHRTTSEPAGKITLIPTAVITRFAGFRCNPVPTAGMAKRMECDFLCTFRC